jgi:hypothetical protein
MSGFTQIQKDVLGKYTKAIVHMRKRLKEYKFSLVLGAGVSKDFGIPDWKTLIKNIAEDRQVSGLRLLEKTKTRPQTSKTQVLFHYFAAKLNSRRRGKNLSQGEIKNEWRNIVRKHLYKKNMQVDDITKKHPYIREFVDIIKDTPMTVNYNFDDYIEQILQKESTDTRDFETVWNPQLQTKRSKCVIYHPNGFLPKHKMERQSEGLVFCEDEFADQLIETMAGRYASLLHQYSQNTCLFIGLSLEDITLKHLLRQSAKLNPGNYHYYVAHMRDNSSISKRHRKAIYEANFNLYNLITMFLTNNEIKELGYLLNFQKLDRTKFIDKARADKINVLYCYYIVGAIGAGKSSVISYYRSLHTHDEWPDFRIQELGKDWEKLSNKQRNKVDKWIVNQFKKKNKVLHDAPDGLHIIDRAPLDPLAFTIKRRRSQKARFLLREIHESDGGARIQAGHVILLSNDTKVLQERARANGKEYQVDKLDKMQKTLEKIYKSPKLSIVDTKGKSLERVVKEIGGIIQNPGYEEFNLHRRLLAIKGGRHKC